MDEEFDANESEINSKDALAALSEDQRSILREFRNTVQGILQPHHDDYFLLRWLKARDFDIIKSEKMIRESFKFRKKLNMDEILTSKYVEPEVHRLYKSTAPLGFDKEGCLVRYLMLGFTDCKGMVYSLHATEMIKAILYHLESDAKQLADHNSKTGLHEARSVYIVDCREFSLRRYYDKHVIRVVIQSFKAYQDNCPETLKVAYITNVPLYFFVVWNIIKRFVDPVTLNKIKIYRPDNESWKEELLRMVDPKIIPAFLGGSLCDPDGNPTCQTIVRWTDKRIPTSYYLREKCVLRADDPDVNTVVVREKSHFEHRVSIKKAGSTLKWEFQTKDYSIHFGIFYEKMKYESTPSISPDELLPVENVDCHVIPEAGELECENTGEYILHFDNNYSWLTSKHLLYKVTVIEPEEDNVDEK